MLEYTLERADANGARFTATPEDRLMAAAPFLAASALLAFFAVQALWAGDRGDRPWAYGLLALSLAAAAGGAKMWHREGPPPVLRFDNLTRTLWFESARGTTVASVPYADIGPLEAGRFSSESNNTSYTTYTIGVTLRDGRRLRLCRGSETVRDEQLALLRRCIRLPEA